MSYRVAVERDGRGLDLPARIEGDERNGERSMKRDVRLRDVGAPRRIQEQHQRHEDA